MRGCRGRPLVGVRNYTVPSAVRTSAACIGYTSDIFAKGDGDQKSAAERTEAERSHQRRAEVRSFIVQLCRSGSGCGASDGFRWRLVSGD